MIAERLRKAVLQAAMEGKLTNQLLNDSKTIITIDKKYAQIQQEQIPYTIPENWKWFRVKELFVIRNGFTPLRSNMDFWNSKDVPWFTVNDIRNQGRVITYTDQYISNLAVTDNKVVPKNSILLCCTASIGEYALTKIDLTTNQQFNGMTIKDKYQEFIDIWFVYYWVQTIKEEMISKAGKTTFPFLSVTKLGDFLISLPPIEEQKRIVEKLEVLLAEIDKLEQDEKALKELEDKFPKKLKNAILQSAIEGKLASIQKSDVCSLSFLEQIKKTRFELVSKKENKNENEMGKIQSSEFIFDIPTNWNWIRLGDIASINTGVTFKKEEQSNNGIRILRGGSISNGQISIYDNDIFLPQEKVKTEHIVRKGDILTPSVTSIEHIGKVGIVKENSNKMAHGGFVFNIRPYLENYIFSKYIYYYIQSPKNIDKLRTLTNKSGQAFYNLGKEKFRKVLIPIPPINEQKHIVEELDKLFAIDLLNI